MEDPIMVSLLEQRARWEEKKEKWLENKDQLLPMVNELVELGCEVDMSDYDLNVRFSGDKEKLLAVIRCQFRHGLRPDLSDLRPGSTSGSWTSYVGELRVWTYFASTVCRRVRTGTKLEEVPVYETVCDDMVPYDLHDEIPF